MDSTSVFSTFPEIQVDDKIILRQFKDSDADYYLSYMSNIQVSQFIPKECIPTNIHEAKQEIVYCKNLFKYKRSVYWAIALKKNDQIIGSCGYNYISFDHLRGEISYDLDCNYWGKGIMSKVLDCIINHSFTQMQINRIEATCVIENKRSLNLLLYKKFIEEGVLKQQKILQDKFYDAIMLSILKKDFDNV